MLYNEIIDINEDFQPVFDITSEKDNNWKTFIPTKNFCNILDKVLDSLGGNNKCSMWIQGSYGTGKSHSLSVIKHLLWDDLSEFEDFLEQNSKLGNDSRLKNKFINFRKNKRIFPIIIKGGGNINDGQSFSIAIQVAVKHTLKKHNIEITTKTDFENCIEFINKNDTTFNWDNLIQGNDELKSKGINNKTSLLTKLGNEDTSVLIAFEKVLKSKDISPIINNITDWLVEIIDQLKQLTIASFLMIYWDEFTVVMDYGKSDILNKIQNIAERSNKDIFLFLVTHRQLEAYQRKSLTDEDIKKVRDRFIVERYDMEHITTYHLISGAIRKKNKDEYNKLKNNYFNNNELMELINNLSKSMESYSSSTDIIDSIKDIFPIHPYSGFIATSLARTVGSSDRSIFSFLDDSEKGFRKFIKIHPRDDGLQILTADYIFNFFESMFNDKSERYDNIIIKYNNYKKHLEEKGFLYNTVFKAIVLLNILNVKADININSEEFFQPNEKNIKNIFCGTPYSKQDIDKVLLYIHKQGYAPKLPNGNYLIQSSNYDNKELDKEKNSISEDDLFRNLFSYGDKRIFDNCFKNTLRSCNVEYLNSNINENLLRNNLNKNFTIDKYKIHIAIFLALKEDNNKIKSIIKKLCIEEEYKHIIFVVLEETLGNDEYNKFVEYIAQEKISSKKGDKEGETLSRKYSTVYINEWFNKIKNGYVEWFLNGDSHKHSTNDFYDLVNTELSRKIFKNGLENIRTLTKNNIWKDENSVKSIEHFLFSNDLDELIERTKSFPWKDVREIILYDNNYIVDKNLKFINSDERHPTVKIWKEVQKRLNNVKGNINLGKILSFLKEPPYGLYKNKIYYALIGIIMHQYIGNMYDAGSSKKITENSMVDIITNLLKYFETNNRINEEKLNIRFTTHEEDELIKKLINIFGLENSNNIDGIISLKWNLKEHINNNLTYPMWLLEGTNKALDKAIIELDKFIKTPKDIVTDTKIKELFSLVEENSIELKKIINKQNMEKCFNNLLNDNFVDESEINIKNIYQYLVKNLQFEIALWNKDKVLNTMKIYFLEEKEKLRKKKEEEQSKTKNINKKIQNNEIKSIDNIEHNIKLKREKIKKKIDSNNDITLLQNVLFNLIEREQNLSILEFIDESLK